MRYRYVVGLVIVATLISAVAMLGGTSSADAAPASLPSTPRAVQAVAGNRRATVSWKAPASSGSREVDRYRVTSHPRSRHCATTGRTTCTVRGLANGTRYTFRVAAQVAADWSKSSSPSPAIVPGVPVDGHLLYPGADLAGTDLRGADLQHVDIQGADLKGANLSGANLAHADLLGVDLSGSTLTRAMLTGADLAYANLYDSSLQHTQLTNADLTGATMTGVTSGGIATGPARFPFGFSVVDGYLAGPGVDLAGVDLAGDDLTGVDLSGANLTDDTLTGADLTNADLAGATMTGVTSGRITTTPAQFPLEYSVVDGYLAGPGANLSGADLAGADLAGADYSNTDLAGANLSGADLSGADSSAPTSPLLIWSTPTCPAQISLPLS